MHESSAEGLSLDTVLYLAEGGSVTIGDCAVGDRIMGADGKPTTITGKSGIFDTPMYELLLKDGRKLKVSDDHLNQVWLKTFHSNLAVRPTYTEATLTTRELLDRNLILIDSYRHRRPLVWIRFCQQLEFAGNTDQLIEPYTVGALIGDGSMNGKAAGQVPAVLIAHEDDWPTYEREIPYPLGKAYRGKRSPRVISRTIRDINAFVSVLGLSTHGNYKRIPDVYLYGSVAQRLAMLQGLMDTDGTCTVDGKCFFSSNSRVLVDQVMFLVRSLGGQASLNSRGKGGEIKHPKAYLRLYQPLFRLTRKLVRQRPPRDDKMALLQINRIPDEPSQSIAVDNAERQFVAGEFVRTHSSAPGLSRILLL